MKTNNINTKNCVGYWSLNSDSLYDTDIFQDLSGNGNNGTSANTPVYASDQAGTPNQAMVFNGTTDVVNCGSDTSIDDIFDSGGTVSAWINPSSDGEGDEGRIFRKWVGWELLVFGESNDLIQIRLSSLFDSNEGKWDTSSAIIPINTWTHIAISYDKDATANNPTFYINGVPYTVASGLTEISTPAGTRNTDAGTTLYIGNTSTASRAFDGSISDVMLFSSALTEDQVRQLYLSGRTTAKIKIDPNSTNYITPKLQKGLILDMPLNSRYTEAQTIYTSDFSAGVDSWTYGKGTATAPNIIGGESNSLKFTTDNIDGQHYIQKSAIVESGKIYQVSFKYYIPSGQSNIDGVRLFGIGGSISSKLTTTDAWTTYTKTFTSTSAGFQIYGYDGANLNWQDAGGDDVFYVKDFIVKELDGTTKDRTPQGNDGTVSGATITENSYDFDGTDDIITIGDVGTTAKTMSFWINLDSTTESILEESDNVGVFVSSGTMSYGSWDNCFIDGVDTDTITTGWHQVILTSTTNVDVSALRLGLVDTTYLDGQLSKVKVFNRVLSASDISYLYSKERVQY